MRYVLTNAQMRAADGFTINELKVPSLTLMERRERRSRRKRKDVSRGRGRALRLRRRK